jgi:general secretion pathway protein F|tara:strand:- start:2618 stop:3850 length:1233 start_codon:yes stop_codon:yes gene_type:complete
MASYSYQALDQNGRTQNGLIQAETERQVVEKLQVKGLTPLAFERQKSASEAQDTHPKAVVNSVFVKRLSNADLCQITQQLSTLLQASLPLDDALKAVIEQSQKNVIKTVLNQILTHVSEGLALAQALTHHPKSFPAAYVATVAAGEQSGNLAKVLERLATYTEQVQATQSRIQLALLYPSMIMLVALGVLVLLLTYVVPQVIEVIINMDQELPALTIGLISVSGFIKTKGVYLLLFGLLALVVVNFALKKPKIQMTVHRILLKTPLIGPYLAIFNAARFSKTLALLTASGVPIVDAFKGAQAVVGNLYLRQHINAAGLSIREGSSIFLALKERPILPPIALHLVASGETSGRLAQMLDQAANQLDTQLQRSISVALSLIEPLMMLVMGGLVLVIVMAILLPIFDMNQMIG